MEFNHIERDYNEKYDETDDAKDKLGIKTAPGFINMVEKFACQAASDKTTLIIYKKFCQLEGIKIDNSLLIHQNKFAYFQEKREDEQAPDCKTQNFMVILIIKIF